MAENKATKNKKPRKTPWWLQIILFVGIAGSGFYAINTWQQAGRVKSKVKAARIQALAADNNYQGLVSQGSTIKYVVSPNGQMSKSGLSTIQAADKAFSLLSTYKSGKDYAKQVDVAKQYISQNSFFMGNQYGGPKLDSTGDSEIDALGLKSVIKNVSTYQLNDRQYVVLVNHAMYKNKDDLKRLNQLKLTTEAFIITGSNGQIVRVQQINGMSPTTGIND